MARPATVLCRMALLLFLVLAPGAPAVGAQSLYTGVVPVSGQGEVERREALPEALRHVLRKLSGERRLPESEALDDALARAGELLLAFGYQDGTDVAPDGAETDTLELVARFTPAAVDRLVRDLGLRRWRTQRSPVVLWVVVDDGRQRALMPVEYEPELEGMHSVAEDRGLPTAWPGLSPELMAQVDVQLLWGGYTEQLLGADSDTEGVAIVAARREGPEWNVRWTYADVSTSTSWRTRDRDLAVALEDGVHQLTDLVASVNAIGPAGQGTQRADLLLTGLEDSADYARSLAYLEGLSLVDGLEVLAVGPAGVRLRLALNTEPAFLEDVLRRDRIMEADEASGAYRLVR